ncbi:amino acid adenylation domain-containing protein [Thiomonas sp.]
MNTHTADALMEHTLGARRLLSQTQQYILMRQELLGSGIYNIGLIVTLEGEVDMERLARAVQDVAAAEPMLRAHVLNTAEGPQWQIEDALDCSVAYTDYPAQGLSPAESERRARQEIDTLNHQPLQPTGPTLWQFAVFRTDTHRHLWLLRFNHLLVDGYGVLLIGQRIAERYNTLAQSDCKPLPPGPDYARFVAREHAYLQSPRFDRDEAFWQTRFLANPSRADARMPALQAPLKPITHRWVAPPDHWKAWARIAARQGLTEPQAMMLFLATYFSKVGALPELLIGTPLHNRRNALDKQTVGVFVNTLPLHLDTDPDRRLPDLMQALAEETRQVMRHQQYPLDSVMARQPPRHGLDGMPFDLMVSFEGFNPHATLGDCRATFAPFSGHPALAPVAAYIRHYGDTPGLPIDLVIDPRAPAALRHTAFLDERLDRHLRNLIDHPDLRLRDLDPLGPTERLALAARFRSTPPQAALPNFFDLRLEHAADNLRVYVLDEALRPQPFDVVGEICIAGAGVAPSDPTLLERTAERFMADPFAPGESLYRSGELGYWSSDGRLHRATCDVGRIASQTSQDDQRSSGTPPRARIKPRTPTEQSLWDIWQEVLRTDDFGVNDHFLELGGHSLTLTQVRSRILVRFAIELPLTQMFQHLSVSEQAALIDRHLHSPGAKQKGSFAAQISSPKTHSATKERTPQVQNTRTGDQATEWPFAPSPPSEPVSEAPYFPASLSQRRMWVIQQFHPRSVAYNIAVSLRLHGPLDPSLLRQALHLLVRRHQGLRTQFALRDQEPVQIILPAVSPDLQFIDMQSSNETDRENAAQYFAANFTANPFDLAAAPLFRLALLQLQQNEYVLLWVLHHTIADNWAVAVLMRESLHVYSALVEGKTDLSEMDLPELKVQYSDYASAQRGAQSDLTGEIQLAYWLERLQGMTDLLLPTDYPRPPEPSFAGHALQAPLPAQLIQSLNRLGVKLGATPFMLLLASFNVLLARLCRSSDIAVGTPIANRHHAATEQLVGTLVNTLVMRNTVMPEMSFDQLVQQVRDTALQAYAHQDAPFDELVDRLNAQRGDHPQDLVRVLFNVLNAPPGRLADVPFTYEPFDFDRVAAQFDLSIHVDTEFSHRIQLEYATDLFSADTAQRLLDSYVFLTEQLLARPDEPVSRHALVTPAQRALIDQWNATAQALPEPLTLPAALQLGAPQRREHPALTDASGRTLSYSKLHARALGVAHHLRQMGMGRGDRVGLCLQRHTDMIAALLGVLEAGAAYVPLDPGFPPQRLHYMASDAELRCLLTETALLPLWADADVPQLALDSAPLSGLHSEQPLAPDPARDARADDPAYLIYTSGSTGQPKGVEVPHRAVVNFLRSMAREPGLRPDDVLLAVTTLSFDIAVLELLLPLAVGARVVLADHAQSRDPFALRDLLQASQATVLQATPSTWRMLLDAGWPGNPRLRAFIGGEALPADLAPRLLAACAEVWNLYGPTETTVWSTCWRVQPQQPIVIGRPIANTQVWILDPQGQLCPMGTPGEIHIGGDGVTLGYFRRPELSAERFILDPFSADHPARLYKTGDLGRWRHDGQLEHLGRLDHQVKIRGFRIELGEIEAALREQPGVATCVLTTHAPTPEDVRLVAYLVAAPGAALPDAADLRQALRARLPDYMVPQHFIPLAALPLLPNGKLDRASLPAPTTTADANPGSAPPLPETPQEQQIAAIWRELLGIERVHLTDNFFDLGGHSLLAMRAVIAIEQRLGWRIAPRRLIFESLGQIARPEAASAQAA